jgi:hypothetical protein
LLYPCTEVTGNNSFIKLAFSFKPLKLNVLFFNKSKLEEGVNGIYPSYLDSVPWNIHQKY